MSGVGVFAYPAESENAADFVGECYAEPLRASKEVCLFEITASGFWPRLSK